MSLLQVGQHPRRSARDRYVSQKWTLTPRDHGYIHINEMPRPEPGDDSWSFSSKDAARDPGALIPINLYLNTCSSLDWTQRFPPLPEKVAAGQLSCQLRILLPNSYDFKLDHVAAMYEKVGGSVLKWKGWDVDFDEFLSAEEVGLQQAWGLCKQSESAGGGRVGTTEEASSEQEGVGGHLRSFPKATEAESEAQKAERLATAKRLAKKKFTSKEHFKCRVCPQTFTAYSALYRHEKTKHGKDFKCRFCDETFTTYRACREYEKNEHGEGFACRFCEKTFTNYTALYRHENTKHGKSFMCRLCDKVFTTQFARN